MALPASLLSRRLIFVTGKGGVGKTTVALALGLAGAHAGRRTIVADLGGVGGIDGIDRIDGVDGVDDQAELRVAPGLFRISVDPQSAMEEYLNVKVPGPAAAALRGSRLFQSFAMATPGMRELLCMGKLWELAQLERRTPDADAYDLVIVDAPASGHGAALLRTPRTFAEIARVGPIANQARTIADTIADPQFTAVVAVSTPEEMPVNETLELREALASAADPLELERVILNGRYPDRFDAADVERLGAARQAAPIPPGARVAALDAALAESRRASQQQLQEQRLRAEFGERLQVLPYLFTASVELPQLELLATELAR